MSSSTSASEVVALDGDRATRPAGRDLPLHARPARSITASCSHLFLFIGADPNTDWLDGCVDLDDKGFVVTGGQRWQRAARSKPAARASSPPATSAAGSTKRVAAAVGEGAAVVAQIHSVLAG